MLKKDRHTPVRKGLVYCSPYCGAGCTLAAHTHATVQAKRLCEALGPQWEPMVWENFGWHWGASIDKWEMHAEGSPRLRLGEVKGWGFYLNGAPHQIVISIDEYDPRVAVKQMLKAVQKVLDGWKKQSRTLTTVAAEMPASWPTSWKE